MKEQDKNHNKREIKQRSNIPEKEFKVIIIKIPTELEKEVEYRKEILKKEIENIKKNQPKMKNSIAKIKNILERVRID